MDKLSIHAEQETPLVRHLLGRTTALYMHVLMNAHLFASAAQSRRCIDEKCEQLWLPERLNRQRTAGSLEFYRQWKRRKKMHRNTRRRRASYTPAMRFDRAPDQL